MLGEVPDGLLAREAVTGDDGGRVDLVLDEVVGAAEEFGRDDDDRGGAVSDLLVLLLRELDEDATGGVFDFDQLEDGGAVVRDGDVLAGELVSVHRARGAGEGVKRRRCRGGNRVPGAVKVPGQEGSGTDSDVVYEHLVEAMGSETGADNVGDGDGGLDILVADFLARDALAVAEQSD